MARIINLSERNKQFGASHSEVLYDLQRRNSVVVILTYGQFVAIMLRWAEYVARMVWWAGQGDKL